jgi:hypothetical protein
MFAASHQAFLLLHQSTHLSLLKKIQKKRKSVAVYRVNKTLEIILWYDHFFQRESLE